MRDFVDLGGTTPPEEQCAQVGSREYDYHDRARKEAKALIGQLRRMLGAEPDNARLSTKSHPHDFGSYLTVVCHFDDGDPLASAYALRCDNEMPQEWDAEARRELSIEQT
jgi:hypothetical protein